MCEGNVRSDFEYSSVCGVFFDFWETVGVELTEVEGGAPRPYGRCWGICALG